MIAFSYRYSSYSTDLQFQRRSIGTERCFESFGTHRWNRNEAEATYDLLSARFKPSFPTSSRFHLLRVLIPSSLLSTLTFCQNWARFSSSLFLSVFILFYSKFSNLFLRSNFPALLLIFAHSSTLYLSIYLCIYLYVCLSIYLSVCLSVYPSIYLCLLLWLKIFRPSSFYIPLLSTTYQYYKFKALSKCLPCRWNFRRRWIIRPFPKTSSLFPTPFYFRQHCSFHISYFLLLIKPSLNTPILLPPSPTSLQSLRWVNTLQTSLYYL